MGYSPANPGHFAEIRRALRDRPRRRRRDHEEPAIGCVWELAVTDHERRAWLRHVLEHGDLEAYVADTFEGDV